MTRRCVTTLCVALFVLGTAGFASATAFTVANYTCTNLYGVPYSYSSSNPAMNFLGFSLSDTGMVSGAGYGAYLTQGAPSINSKVLLECGPAGFGVPSFTGNSTDGFVSHNANYTNQGMPTSGTSYRTGAVMDGDYLAQTVANASGKFYFSAAIGAGSDIGHLWSTSGGVTSPAALTNTLAGSINDNGLVAAGSYSALAGDGVYGVVYNTVGGTSTTMTGPALCINNAGQVGGNANGYAQGWVWNASASTYWPAGTTNVSGLSNVQSISQSGRYLAGFVGAWGSSIHGALYDAQTHSILKSIAGEAFAVNNTGWLGGDTDTTWGGAFPGTAWLWDGTTQHNLNTELATAFPSVVSGYTICAVWGINNSNQVLVWGKSSGGQIESFLLSPVPEPSTLLLLASGAIGLLAYAWRKRK